MVQIFINVKTTLQHHFYKAVENKLNVKYDRNKLYLQKKKLNVKKYKKMLYISK